ncbi:hypothetical protein CPC16_008984, partial [Podila verticillata]
HPQGYQPLAPRPGEMEEPASQYSSSSGWNQRLPGYSTVASSPFTTRLSSTGIVHSTGPPPPNSPPHYPRYPTGTSSSNYPLYRPAGPSQGHEYLASEAQQGPQGQQGQQGPQAQGTMAPHGGHPYGSRSSPSQGSVPQTSGYSTSYHHPAPGHKAAADIHERERGLANGGPASGAQSHLPPISMPHQPHPSHSTHPAHPAQPGHHPLPRPSEIMHEQGHPSHNPYGHHRRASSPPHNAINGAPGGSPLAPGPGVPNSNDVLQKTRQDLQREVTNLSMLLGRAAAVLSGLDQALDPHNAGATGSPPGPHHIMQVNVHTPHENDSPVHGYNHGGHGNHIHASHNHGHGHPPSTSMTPPTSMPSDMTTNSALASLMALGSSGGPAHPGAPARHEEHEMMPPGPHYVSHHGPPPSRYPQAIPYPLPRRS